MAAAFLGPRYFAAKLRKHDFDLPVLYREG
jgi:hypothetical protein